MKTKPFDGVKMGKTKSREFKIGNKKLSKKLKNIKMFEEFLNEEASKVYAHHIKVGEHSPIDVKPADGKHFTLEELQKFVGGYIEQVWLPKTNAYMIVNEEGKLDELEYNESASAIWKENFGSTDMIVGDVLISTREYIDDDEELEEGVVLSKDEIKKKIKDGTFEEVGYPCGTTAFYDEANNAYYNGAGQHLRDPREYDKHAEGYTPFGDEGDDNDNDN